MNTSHYHSLYTFTRSWVVGARRMAKSGRKNDARDILRFVRNARIIEILKPVEFLECFNVDVPHLEWQLSELESECHPMAQADFKDDISAIRAQMDVMAGGLSLVITELRNLGSGGRLPAGGRCLIPPHTVAPPSLSPALLPVEPVRILTTG